MTAPLDLDALERKLDGESIDDDDAGEVLVAVPALIAEVRRLRAIETAALTVTTDAAQEILEDPMGSNERLPFIRVHRSALDGLNAVIARAKGETK